MIFIKRIRAANPVGHPAHPGDGQQKGRGWQDHHRDQSRHRRLLGDRRAGDDRRSRSQGNASPPVSSFAAATASCSTYDVLIGEAPLRDAVVPTAGVPRLHIAASTNDLYGPNLN